MSGLPTRIGVIVMTLLLALYLVFGGWYAITLLGTGEPFAIGMGVALLVLALLGAVFLVAELVFAVRAERLARRLEVEGGLPEEEFPLLPSGRIDRNAADDAFPVYRQAVEESPEDWAAWYRLSLAYDASGDRRRARWAVREAIRLEATPGSPRG